MPYLMESADLYICYVPKDTEIMSYVTETKLFISVNFHSFRRITYFVLL